MPNNIRQILHHMSPATQVDDVVDCASANVKGAGDVRYGFAGCVSPAHFTDDLGVQRRTTVPFATREKFWSFMRPVVIATRYAFGMQSRPMVITACGVSLGVAIRNVVKLSAKKEMIRIDTGLVVAGMADAEAVWNRTVCQLPRDDMSGSGDAGDANLSIPIRKRGGSPRPTRVAIIANGDLFPESLSQGTTLKSVCTIARTEAPPAFFNFEGRGNKSYAAMFADPVNRSGNATLLRHRSLLLRCIGADLLQQVRTAISGVNSTIFANSPFAGGGA